MKLFLIGKPRSGKTTLFLKIISSLDIYPSGFYTEEIRKQGMRTGFRIKTFDGRQGILATISKPMEHKIGKYYVDVATFERIAIPSLTADAEFYAIDEIGKMEMLSKRFSDTLDKIINSDKQLIATVGLNYKNILPDDGTVLEVKQERFDQILHKVTDIFKSGHANNG